jgi:inorganic pyrophosphatase
MNNAISKILPTENNGETINVIVEIQKGSKNKYELDKGKPPAKPF